jgi:hypothetical protein
LEQFAFYRRCSSLATATVYLIAGSFVETDPVCRHEEVPLHRKNSAPDFSVQARVSSLVAAAFRSRNLRISFSPVASTLSQEPSYDRHLMTN